MPPKACGRGQQPTKDKASITLCYVCHAVAHDVAKDMLCERSTPRRRRGVDAADHRKRPEHQAPMESGGTHQEARGGHGRRWKNYAYMHGGARRRCCALVGCLAIGGPHCTPPCKQQMWQEGQGVCFLWMKKTIF